MNKEKLEKIGFGILGVFVLVVCLYSFLFDRMEHIEDRNGASNNNIGIITNSQIIKEEISQVGMKFSKSNMEIAGFQFGGVKFHSKKFSGVAPLLQTNLLFSSNYSFTIYNYEIHEGNFGLYVILDDKIIDVLKPQEDSTYYLGDIKGDLRIVAVGESANFEFEMTHTDYDQYYHYAWD